MTGYTVCAVVLTLGGLGPGLWVACRGDAIARLVGLEIVSAVAVVLMLVMAQVTGQSFYLSVPLVLTPLSYAGTLVFTRLLARGEGS